MNHAISAAHAASFPGLAIVGCGAAAREFYLPRLAKYPEFRRTGVLVDCSLSQARAVAHEFGVEHYCDDHQSLSAPIDAAIITTPHKFHAPQAIHFIRQRKHVFVEKPLAMDRQQAQQVIAESSAAGVIAMVNNYRRLFPSYRRVHEIIRSGRLGRIQRISIQDGTQFAWNSESGFYLRDPQTRGVFLDRGAHTIDIVCWWLDGQPKVTLAKHDAFDGVEGLMDIELCLETTMIDVKFSRFYRLKNNYRIEGENGRLEGRLFDFGQLQFITKDSIETIYAGKPKLHHHYAWDLVSNFIQSVQQHESPLFTAEDVARSICVIDEAYQMSEPFPRPWYDRDANIDQLKRVKTQRVMPDQA